MMILRGNFRKASMFLAIGLAALTQGCTTYRILRYREPDARNQSVFPHRTVRKAAAPFQFARAAVSRDDLDTVTVRSPDGEQIPWQEYMEKYSVLGFVVVRNDTIIYERYRDGLTAETVHSSFSVAKSVLSALLGAALADGSIRSLDQRVTEFVPELRKNPALERVTLKNLLEMKSGLRYTEAEGSFIDAARSDEARIYYTSNIRKAIVNTPAVDEPGSKWVYKDTDAEMLGLAIANATGKTIAQYTEEKVWRRIGAEHDATWNLDSRDGQEKVSSGFNATLRDFARFGRLYLMGGNWNGVQVLPASWVATSSAVDTTRPDPEISNWWQMQHSFYWWHALQPKQGDFYADGSHGQRIYVNRSTNTVIVQLANDSDQDFPFRRIDSYLNGIDWEYPRSIAQSLRAAAKSRGAQAMRPMFDSLIAERDRSPEKYVLTSRGLRTLGRVLTDSAATRASGIELLRIATEYSPHSAEGFVALSDAYIKVDDRASAIEAIRRARKIAPSDADIAEKAKALGVR